MKCMLGSLQVHAASNGYFITITIISNDCQPDASLRFTSVRVCAFRNACACVYINCPLEQDIMDARSRLLHKFRVKAVFLSLVSCLTRQHVGIVGVFCPSWARLEMLTASLLFLFTTMRLNTWLWLASNNALGVSFVFIYCWLNLLANCSTSIFLVTFEKN